MRKTGLGVTLSSPKVTSELNLTPQPIINCLNLWHSPVSEW